MSAILSIIMLAQQSNTTRGADGSVMQVVDLNAPFDPENGFDGASRLRFCDDVSIGQIRPGNSYKVTFEDLGRIAPPVQIEPSEVDLTTESAPAPAAETDQQVQVWTTPPTDPAPEAPDAEAEQTFVVAEDEPVAVAD